MISQKKNKRDLLRQIVGSQKGFLLIAALTLLATLTLVGTTAFILSSTDIKISGNFKTNHMALQAAMAGAERAREAFRVANLASANTVSFSDDLAARVGSNGILDGYAAGTDDVVLVSGSLPNVSYVAYLTNNPTEGTSNQTDSDRKVMITSVATGPNGSTARVEVVVKSNPGASSPATIYSKGNVTGNGSSLSINGNDNCGGESPLAPVYTKDPSTTNLNGSPTLNGDPPTPQHGPLNIDIQAYVDELNVGATVLTSDQNNTNFGSSTNYVTLYSDTSNPPNANGLKIQNGTGYGTLLVKGDLTLGGGFTWNGLIVVTGTLTFNGGGGPNAINIKGQVIAGDTSNEPVDINGNVDIKYDSCEKKKALAGSPLEIVSWKHVY